MATKQSNGWQTISLTPLNGILDTRSRPAEIPPGAFRYKGNIAVTDEGKICRRGGHERIYSDYLYDAQGNLGKGTLVGNHDLHMQGAAREPITMGFESTAPDKTRRLFTGTQSRVYLLDEPTGTQTAIITGKGAYQTRFHAAELQDCVLFTNDNDNVIAYRLSDGSITDPIPQVVQGAPNGVGVTKAKVILQYAGFMFLMNVVQDGKRLSNRIVWSDLNNPLQWLSVTGNIDPTQNTLCGFQDLDYGDAILAAAVIRGGVYIYTERSIWLMVTSGDVSASSDPNTVFAFTQRYNEPKNQSACIAFPNSLISTGDDHWYVARDGIYHFNPYLGNPERPDWLHRADGVMFRKLPTQMDTNFCESIVGDYRPDLRELWWSWPAIGQNGINNLCLVAHTEQKTADIVDTGYTAFVNWRRNPITIGLCNTVQDFIGASGVDWALKSIGDVFFRQFITLIGAITADITGQPLYADAGYVTMLRGLIPTGLYDREKIIRNVLLDHDTTEESVPGIARLRIGTGYNLLDPNDLDPRCSPIWFTIKPDKVMDCPDGKTVAQFLALNQRPNLGTEWKPYYQARFLFFELSILNKDGSPAIGVDTCLQRLDFDVMGLPKP